MLILTVNVAIYALVCKLCTHGPYGLLYFEIKLYTIFVNNEISNKIIMIKICSFFLLFIIQELAIYYKKIKRNSAGPKGGQKGHMPPRSDHKAYLAPRKKS